MIELVSLLTFRLLSNTANVTRKTKISFFPSPFYLFLLTYLFLFLFLFLCSVPSFITSASSSSVFYIFFFSSFTCPLSSTFHCAKRFRARFVLLRSTTFVMQTVTASFKKSLRVLHYERRSWNTLCPMLHN
jgi:hypothetical protein